MHLQAALEAFQVQLAADGRSEHTRRQYQRHVRAFAGWLRIAHRKSRVAAVTPQVVAEFFASDTARLSCRGGAKKATSANAQRTSLRCFFRWAHDAGLLHANPARLLRRARCAPPPPKALRDDEQERLLAVLADAVGPEADRDRILVELLLGTGVRIGSALALDIGDIDLVHGELTLRRAKNDRPSVAIVPAALVPRLRSFIGDRTAGPLFLACGRRISMRHAQRRIARRFELAGIQGRSTHALRHTFANTLLARTNDLRLVQAALHHSSIISTTVYTSVDRSKLRAAVWA